MARDDVAQRGVHIFEHGNYEYEGWENIETQKITNLQRNNPQETPCTLPQDNKKSSA
jgi:hypothetical protein